MRKRILAFILTIIMIVGMFPVGAFAQDIPEGEGLASEQSITPAADQPDQQQADQSSQQQDDQSSQQQDDQSSQQQDDQSSQKQDEQSSQQQENQSAQQQDDQSSQQQDDESNQQPEKDKPAFAPGPKDKDKNDPTRDADALAELFRALPDASILTPETTEEEKTALLEQVYAALSAYDTLCENDIAEAFEFENNYGELYEAALALEQAILEYEPPATYVEHHAYDKSSWFNLTINVVDEKNKGIEDAVVTITSESGNHSYEVVNQGNGKYKFTRVNTSHDYYYDITVTAPGYMGSSTTLAGDSGTTTIALQKLEEDLSGENWQTFRVFYIATGELPAGSYTAAGSAKDYGPSGNDTPLVLIDVDINKLRDSKYSDVVLYEENNGNQWHFIPRGQSGSVKAAKAFWNVVKECMSSDSIAAFEATGLYENYIVYVLKKQTGGSQHADGILDVKPPVYIVELNDQGVLFESSAKDANTGNFKTREEVLESYKIRIGHAVTWDQNWSNGNTIKGIYTTDTDVYTVTVYQSNFYSGVKAENKNNIKYVSRNDTDTYYLAAFDSSITEGAEGWHTVTYTDGAANEVLFPDWKKPFQTADNIPQYDGTAPENARPGYTFQGWTLEGGDGTIYSAEQIAEKTIGEFPAAANSGNIVFNARWYRLPTEFRATLNVLLNENTPYDIDYMLGNGTVLAIKTNTGEYYTVSREGEGVYSAMVPNGEYFVYYKQPGDSEYTKLDERSLVVAGNEASRKLKFNSVIYDLAGGTATGIESYYVYHAGTSVNVVDVVPTRPGYVFKGWQSGENIYQPAALLTDDISTPYVLTAQWEDAIDVYVTVVINHDKDNTELNDDVSFSLVELKEGLTVHTGLSRQLSAQYLDGYTAASQNQTITYTPQNATFTGLPKANYTVNCFKAGYTNKVTTITDENGDQHITLTLTYAPDYFPLKFDVKLNDEAKEMPNSVWPTAVRVKIVRWVDGKWVSAVQHTTTSAYVEIDKETGEGSGQVEVAKYYPSAGGAVAYRSIVTAYIMPDGTIVSAGHKENANYPSANGVYNAEMTIENGGKVYEPAGLEAAFYDDESKVQNGTPTATISINTHTVNFHADTIPNVENNATVAADNTGAAEACLTFNNRVRIPEFSGFVLNAPAGYVFDGWWTQNGSKAENGGDWGEKAVAGTYIAPEAGTVDLYAKWKAPVTIKGTIYAPTSYFADGVEYELFDHDWAGDVVVLLKQERQGGNFKTQTVTVQYTEGQDYGKINYEFANVPDDGSKYYIDTRITNFSDRFLNEEGDIAGKLDFNNYTADMDHAVFGNDAVAEINVVLDFDPLTFDLRYQVDASAIDEDFRPETAEILVTSRGSSAEVHPSLWEVITQMRNGEELVGDNLTLNNGLGSGETTVWQSFPDGNRYYQYGIRVAELTGLGEKTVPDQVPYSVEYKSPATYDAANGQSQMLEAMIKPNKYPVTYVLGIDSTAVSGMENAPAEHTWSFDTDLSSVKPQRSGYKFLGWYEDEDFTGTPVNKIDAVRNEAVTLYAKWAQVQDIVNLTVIIDHGAAGGGSAGDFDKSLHVQLTRATKGVDNPYFVDVADVPPRSFGEDTWHKADAETETDTLVVQHIFSGLSSEYLYSLNVALDEYELVSKTVDHVTDEASGITAHNVVIMLKFNPELLYLTLNAKMADGVPEELWPVAAEVKINCWYQLEGQDSYAWNTISQHENTTLTIALDESGQGSVGYNVWQWEDHDAGAPCYYRMEVVAVKLSDNSVVHMQSTDNVRYLGQNYIADIVTDEGCIIPESATEKDALPGAYGSDNKPYTQNGTLTAVISADLNHDNTPDYQQATIKFVSYDANGTVSGKTEQLFNLTKLVNGRYTDNVKPDNVTLTAKRGYEFSHWSGRNLSKIENPFVNQDVYGGETITYTAHWKPAYYPYTVLYLAKDETNTVLHTLEGTAPFGSTISASANMKLFEGYVFDHAEPENPEPGVINIEVKDPNADADKDKNVLTLYYAKDANKDNTADYMQAFINFVVYADGEGERHLSLDGNDKQVFELSANGTSYSGSVTPSVVTPVPEKGYVFTGWKDEAGGDVENPFVSHNVNGGDTITYTAHWDIRRDYRYTVRYIDRGTGLPVIAPEDKNSGLYTNTGIDKETVTKTVSNLTFNSTHEEIAPEIFGYVLDSTSPQTVTMNEDNQEIIFYYKKQSDLKLTVKYMEVVGGEETDVEIHDDTVVSGLEYMAEPDLEVLKVSIDGFAFSYCKQGDVVTDKVVMDERKTITMYYQRNTVPYTVYYYFDDVLDGKTRTIDNALFGDVITWNEDIHGLAENERGEYTLDYYVGLPLTIKAEAGANVVHVYYAKDEIGVNDPEQGDGTPDKYQALVTFKVMNGKWTNDGTQTVDHANVIKKVYNLFTWNTETGSITPTNATIGTLPTAVNNPGHYNGKWDHKDLSDQTLVEHNAEFVFAFEPRQYTIHAEVVNGSVNGNGASASFKQVVSYSETDETMLHFAPYEGYILDYVRINGEYYRPEKSDDNAAILGFERSFKHTGDYTIYVVYSQDSNDDEIPDDYQAKITFKVVNGTWVETENRAEGNADIVEYFTVKKLDTDKTSNTYGQLIPVDNLPTLEGKIPTAKANENYDESVGTWDHNEFNNLTQNGKEIVVTDDHVYTYSYTRLNEHLITVVVINGKAKKNGQLLANSDNFTVSEDGGSTTLEFTHDEGYILESVTADGSAAVLSNGSHIFDHTKDHHIRVEYTKDEIGPNGGPDEIPDKYQATVTYAINNGTWKDTENSTATISQVYTIYTKSETTGEWVFDNNVTLVNVPDGIPNRGYTNGIWEPNLSFSDGEFPVCTTKVTGNAHYLLGYTLDYYDITVVVNNGSAEEIVSGTSVETSNPWVDKVVPHDENTNTRIKFTANEGYILDNVLVNEKPLSETELVSFKENGIISCTHDNDYHIMVEYAPDLNGDGTADKYQKKVTFRVENGSFVNCDDAGKTEKVVYVELKKDDKFAIDGSGTLEVPTVPTETVSEADIMPVTGYTNTGEWDVTPPANVSGTNDVVYTYRFTEKQKVTITIEVVNGSSNPVHSETVYDYDSSRHTITFTPNDGYVFYKAERRTSRNGEKVEKIDPFDGTYEHDHTQDEHIYVEYTKNALVRFVSADTAKGVLGSVEHPVDSVDKYFALEPSEGGGYCKVVKPEAVAYEAIKGYVFSHWSLVPGGDEIKPFEENGLTVYDDMVIYANWVPMDVPYQVNYIDESGNVIKSQYTGTGKFGETISAETFVADNKNIVVGERNYVFISANDVILGVDKELYIINITYGLDNWKDSPNGEDSETGGDGTPDSQQALVRFSSFDENGEVRGKTLQIFTLSERIADIVHADVNSVELHPNDGYKLSHWAHIDQPEQAVKPEEPLAVFGGMEVDFKAHWSERTDLSYTVNFLDLSGVTIGEPVTFTNKTFGTQISVDSHKKHIAGYVFDHADPTNPNVTTGSNILNLYYAADSNKDNIPDYKQFFVNFVAGENGSVDGHTVQVFTLDKNSEGKYKGTVTPHREPASGCEIQNCPGLVVTPAENYVEDYWTLDGSTAPVNPFAEMAAEGGKSVTFTVHFAENKNGDNVPDKYQATVTYKVHQGFWNDNKDDADRAKDKTETFTLYQKNADTGWSIIDPAVTLGTRIPDVSGAVPDADNGFTAPGHWGNKDQTSDDPTAETPVVDGAVYTYSFSDLIPYTVTVTVTNGSFSSEKIKQRSAIESTVSVNFGDELKLSFAANQEGGNIYALESVTVDGKASALTPEETFTFKNIRDNHTINVVYSVDEWSDPKKDTDPETPGDRIADCFQVKVTYNARPAQFGTVALMDNEGTAIGEGSAVVSEVHTILNDGKPATEGSVQFSGAIATVKSGDENGVNKFSGWTGGIVALAADTGAEPVSTTIVPKFETVHGGSEYEYYANFSYEMRHRAVYFVEHYLWDEVQRSYVLDEDATVMGNDFVGEEVSATAKDYAGYALNTVKSQLKGVVTMPQGQHLVEAPTGLLTLKLYYDKDNGDGVPDIFQKKVIFRVVNGTWRHASLTAGYAVTERVVWLTLLDANGESSPYGTAELTAPTDMKPDRGYAYGRWDKVPPAEVSGTDTEVYTYRYYSIWTPKTGDDSNIPMWLGFMGLSFVGMLGTVLGFKRKKKSE